jgi:hypothetical protein
MQKLIRRLYASAAIAGAALSPQVQAATAVIDFEPASLTGLYFAGDSFSQSGFTMTASFDAGTVDVASALIPNAPSGNATQFYSGLNDGGLIMQRTDGGLFDLKSFDAAFIPLSQPGTTTTVIVAVANNNGVAWLFPANNGTGYPFGNYSNPVDFANFMQVKKVEFFACAYDGAGICFTPTRNNGQFAIDNITANVTAVPEPTITVMLSLGLLGLALRARRSAR